MYTTTVRTRGLVTTVTVVVALFVSLAATPALSAPPDHAPHERTVTVMTRNLYLGATLDPIFAAADPVSLAIAVNTVWQQVLATDFPERAGALADEIVDHRPDLVGLQEVTIWRSGPLGATDPVEDVEFDFLAILLDELAARGHHYEPVVSVTNFDDQLPNPFIDRMLRMTDQGVILARGDARRAELGLSNPQAGNFVTNLSLPILGEPVEVLRGWTAVDVKVRGKAFRFVNTHLEAFHPAVRFAQAMELLAGPADSELPVVLVGDVNSAGPPADPPGNTYALLTNAGFVDAWIVDRPGEPGLTCCHDADLLNEVPTLTSRIDVVMTRGPFGVATTAIVGADPADRTASGLWPSDHAGVVATIVIPSDRPSKR